MLMIANREVKGITSFTTYASGEIKECRLDQYNLIHSRYGDFIPQYTYGGIRKKQLKSLSFYKSGHIKSIALERQTRVATPIGAYPAELVTFYEDGALNSLFPLNGQIGFGWTEAEEKQLAQNFDFTFPFGAFTGKITGLRFYPHGQVKSIILWPDEIIHIDTPLGKIPVRVGFKLYEDGKLESLEPAWPVAVKTPAGMVKAFDMTALAVDADCNSLRFDRNGQLKCLTAFADINVRNTMNGQSQLISRRLRPGLLEDDFIKIPIKLWFGENTVVVDNGAESVTCNLVECCLQMVGLDEEIPIAAACRGCS